MNSVGVTIWCAVLGTANRAAPRLHFCAAVIKQLPDEAEGAVSADLFTETPVPMPTRTVHHELRLKNSCPFQCRPHRYAPEKRRIIYDQVQEMLSTGVIAR